MNAIGICNYNMFIHLIIGYILQFCTLLTHNIINTFVLGGYRDNSFTENLFCVLLLIHNIAMLIYALMLFRQHWPQFSRNITSIEFAKMGYLFCRVEHIFKNSSYAKELRGSKSKIISVYTHKNEDRNK